MLTLLLCVWGAALRLGHQCVDLIRWSYIDICHAEKGRRVYAGEGDCDRLDRVCLRWGVF